MGIYRALPAQGRLERVYPPTDAAAPAVAVDLHDPACVEAQTFHHSTYALRGTADEARLVVTLTAGSRPIGVVTVERYVTHRDPHELPGELPDVLHFLQHAASALENVMIRAAYRTIGQAVLDARAMQPTVTACSKRPPRRWAATTPSSTWWTTAAGRPGSPRAWAGPAAMSRARMRGSR